MNQPSEELLAMLAEAAQLRAGGASWETVATKVERSARTCRDWPRLHAKHWRRLYRQAEQQLRAEGSAEAVLLLRRWLRDEDPKTSLGAAGLLLKSGSSAKDTRENLPQVEPDEELIRFVAQLKGKDDVQLDVAHAQLLRETVGHPAGEADPPLAEKPE